MEKVSLVVMAAGMGSRYGGLKQLDEVGPNGETIIDYSVFDAIRAGFSKIVFIIRKEFESDFRIKVGDKFSSRIQIEYAFQDIRDLPAGFTCPAERQKPWGTGQAILTAAPYVKEAFFVINGDDFYGAQTFKTAADYYQQGARKFSMIAFQMDKTFSEFGAVTRGVCEVADGCLKSIQETEGLQRVDGRVISGSNKKFSGQEPVSMNMWGFTPVIFDYLREKFSIFLQKHGQELKSEFYIPSVVNELINEGREDVHVLTSPESWFGVTYKEDKPYVVKSISSLISSGVYPDRLF